MTETVTRHRGAGRDENGQLIPATDEPLTPSEIPGLGSLIAPGGGTEHVERLRDGETIACTVYFPLGTDIINSDELTVRGERFSVIVNDWRTPIGGLEVLCTRGQG